MKNILKYTVILLIIIGSIMGGYLLINQLSVSSFTAEASGFRLESEYTSENIWEYTLNGELPNPCHEYEVRVDNEAEEIIITLVIFPPESNTICTEVIEPLEIRDIIEAERSQTFEFQVIFAEPGSDNEPINESQFELTSQYNPDKEIWEYSVVGELPNSCFEVVDIDSLIAESFPEQVKIQLTVLKTSNICTQQIIPVEINDTYDASPEASVDLLVIYEE